VGSYLDPVPAPMPGYASDLVMAGGSFIDGSTSELSADGPLREPYVLYVQGGTHHSHAALALEQALGPLRARIERCERLELPAGRGLRHARYARGCLCSAHR
jgi:hypothetical protein